MKDYKNLSRSLRVLKREIEETFSELSVVEVKKRGKKKHFNFRYLIIGIWLLAPLLFFANQEIFNKDKIYNQIYSFSYIGNVKAINDYNEIQNPNAVGDSESPSVSTVGDEELSFFFYRVQQGESIYSISQKMGLNMDSLISLNSIDNAHSISVNKRLLIPSIQGILYSVQSGDSLEKISDTYDVDIDIIKEANEMLKEDIYPGDLLFLPGAEFTSLERALALGYWFYKPLRGRFTSGYGWRKDPFTGISRFHSGIDIAAALGTTVRSAKEGKVVFAGWNGGNGKFIIIKHQFGYSTSYSHLSSILVSVGQWVSAGQAIGRVGSTGRSTGPHLHLEVLKFGTTTNPLTYEGLRKSPGSWY